MFESLKSNYETVWKLFIRPPRSVYNEFDLGPNFFSIAQYDIERRDFSLKNRRNQALACSFYEVKSPLNQKTIRPCVIYLHCNSGSRIEAISYADYVLNYGMHFFSFDFSGSGLSDGEFISLGVKETEDLEIVVKYLREKLFINQIILWGRSMGAVTALRYVDQDMRINGIIVDSPFSSLYKLALELGEDKTSIPGILLPPMLKIVEQTIKEKAGFEFKALEITNFIRNTTVPCIFITSKEDNFVRSQHVECLYDMYGGNKKILYVNGDHNNERAHEFLDNLVKTILEMLVSKKTFREFPAKQSLPDCKTLQKIFVNQINQENQPALPLSRDRENRKIFNLQNILETNKEIAKKIVISKKKEPVARLDTEVLYDEIPEISNQNQNKTCHSSAFRLKDKMQSLIHNSNSNNNNPHNSMYSLSNGNNLFPNYESIGSVKHSTTDPKRVLNEYQPKTFSRNNITNSPYKREYNRSFHSKPNQFAEGGLNEKKEDNSQIKLNNLCYSNPVDLKKESYNSNINPYQFLEENKQKGGNKLSSLTTRNKHFL